MLIDAPNRDLQPRPPDSPDRLTGWKDVAAHVGKSIRTSQRWEKALDLPVHRITTPNGEVVYAFRTELDEWLRSHDAKVRDRETSVASTRPSNRYQAHLLLVGSVAAVVLMSLVAFLLVFGVPPGRSAGAAALHVVGDGSGPVGWRVEDGRLKVYNSRDERLWEYRFSFPLDERAYLKDDSARPSLVAIADLENDGDKEVLFIARGRDVVDSALYCFDRSGAVRFSAQPRRRVRFGNNQEYAPPYEVQQIFLTMESDRKYTLWLVANHHAWFPSVLEKLTHTGDVVAEYWNDGRIQTVRETRVGSRRVMLVAGNNVEYRGPSLAVLDYDSPGGAAPADDPRFRCANCGSGAPAAAFVMPFTSLWSEMNLQPDVDDILLAKNGYITLALHGRRLADSGTYAHLDVLCTFDEHFDVVDLEATDTGASRSVQAANMTRAGPSVDARLQMFPILRWLGGQRAR